MKKYFDNIVIQSKNDLDHFGAFAHVQDSKGNWWELRAHDITPGKAADQVWKYYQDEEQHWDIYGYIINK